MRRPLRTPGVRCTSTHSRPHAQMHQLWWREYEKALSITLICYTHTHNDSFPLFASRNYGSELLLQANEWSQSFKVDFFFSFYLGEDNQSLKNKYRKLCHPAHAVIGSLCIYELFLTVYKTDRLLELSETAHLRFASWWRNHGLLWW